MSTFDKLHSNLKGLIASYLTVKELHKYTNLNKKFRKLLDASFFESNQTIRQFLDKIDSFKFYHIEQKILILIKGIKYLLKNITVIDELQLYYFIVNLIKNSVKKINFIDYPYLVTYLNTFPNLLKFNKNKAVYFEKFLKCLEDENLKPFIGTIKINLMEWQDLIKIRSIFNKLHGIRIELSELLNNLDKCIDTIKNQEVDEVEKENLFNDLSLIYKCRASSNIRFSEYNLSNLEHLTIIYQENTLPIKKVLEECKSIKNLKDVFILEYPYSYKLDQNYPFEVTFLYNYKNIPKYLEENWVYDFEIRFLENGNYSLNNGEEKNIEGLRNLKLRKIIIYGQNYSKDSKILEDLKNALMNNPIQTLIYLPQLEEHVEEMIPFLINDLTCDKVIISVKYHKIIKDNNRLVYKFSRDNNILKRELEYSANNLSKILSSFKFYNRYFYFHFIDMDYLIINAFYYIKEDFNLYFSFMDQNRLVINFSKTTNYQQKLDILKIHSDYPEESIIYFTNADAKEEPVKNDQTFAIVNISNSEIYLKEH